MSTSQADKLFELYKTSKQASVEKRLEDIFGFTNAGEMAKHTLPYSLGGAGLGALLGVLREYTSANPEATGLESDALRTILTSALLGGGVGTSLGYFTSSPKYKSSAAPAAAPPSDEQTLDAVHALVKVTREDDWVRRGHNDSDTKKYIQVATSPAFDAAGKTLQHITDALAIANNPQADPKDQARASELATQAIATYKKNNYDQVRADGYMALKGLQSLAWDNDTRTQVASQIKAAIEFAANGQGQLLPGVRVERAHSSIMGEETPTTLIDITDKNGQPTTISLPFTDIYANGAQTYKAGNPFGYSPYIDQIPLENAPLRPTQNMARLAAGLEYHQEYSPGKNWTLTSPEVVAWADNMNRQQYNYALTSAGKDTRGQFDQTINANPNFMEWVSRIESMANSSLEIDANHSYLQPSTTNVASIYGDAAADTRPGGGWTDMEARLDAAGSGAWKGGLVGGVGTALANPATAGLAYVGDTHLYKRPTPGEANQIATRLSNFASNAASAFPNEEAANRQLSRFAKDMRGLAKIPGLEHAKDMAKALTAESKLTGVMEMTEAAKKHWMKAQYPIDVMNAGRADRIAYLRKLIGGTVHPTTGKVLAEGAGKSILETARGLRGKDVKPYNWGSRILRNAGYKVPLVGAGLSALAYGGYKGILDTSPTDINELDIITNRMGKYLDSDTSQQQVYGNVPGQFDMSQFDSFRNMGDK